MEEEEEEGGGEVNENGVDDEARLPLPADLEALFFIARKRDD